jgi:hypothetical protein
MNTYLAIITTLLVVTQIIRLIQNTIQLRKQDILFKEQLGQIQDVTPEDFAIQKKAYRLMVEYFESRKIKPPTIGEERKNVVNVVAEVEVDELIASHDPELLESKLKEKLGEEVLSFATVQTLNNPMSYTVKKRATASVVERW